MADLRVLVVAQDPLVRTGLAAMLSGQPGCVVVGQAAGLANLPDEVAIHRPDAIVWDLGWDPSPTLEDLTGLGALAPTIVALLPDEGHASDAWSAGARALLLRSAGAEQLVAAVAALVEGLAALDVTLAAALFPAGHQPQTSLVEELTTRELEVVQLLAEGLSNKAIALKLNISEHTVKFHVNAILGKLGAQSRTEAVVRATRLGLIIL